jgi:hypothetical protein
LSKGHEMNAQLAFQANQPWGERVVDALVRVRLSTRVLLLAAATMLGALVYMTANWPAPQPAVNVTVATIMLRTAAVPAQQVPLPKAETPETAVAGGLVVDAARVVSAAAAAPLAARINPSAPGSLSVAASVPAGPSSPSSPRTARLVPQGGVIAPQNADNAAEPVFPSLPPGINRIAVPTPASATGSGSVPNHIGVPPTQPPSGP